MDFVDGIGESCGVFAAGKGVKNDLEFSHSISTDYLRLEVALSNKSLLFAIDRALLKRGYYRIFTFIDYHKLLLQFRIDEYLAKVYHFFINRNQLKIIRLDLPLYLFSFLSILRHSPHQIEIFLSISTLLQLLMLFQLLIRYIPIDLPRYEQVVLLIEGTSHLILL